MYAIITIIAICVLSIGIFSVIIEGIRYILSRIYVPFCMSYRYKVDAKGEIKEIRQRELRSMAGTKHRKPWLIRRGKTK